MVRYFLLFLLISTFSCKEKPTVVEVVPEKVTFNYSEKFRPQYHFSPPEKWMNDPNGLVYHNGIYHLFYQFYPEDIVWGPMHWGHATSKDLIHWEHKPIALYPDEIGDIFSGSAVVDVDNTSGFGSKENPALVAIFTYHLMAGEKAGRKDFQTQGIAYSLDNGDTWVKYENNPVIGNDGIKDFRDPKVMWHAESSQWILTLVAGDHAKFYGSPNLKDWKLLSEFGKEQGAHGGVWECPDLFKLKVEGTDEEKWVLLVSINPGAPNGGSGTQYFVGDFDGETFRSDQKEHKWIDTGRDNYAGVTYNNTPTNERIFIGWMSNWDYAMKTPTEVWRSSMTLPRTMSLHKNKEDFFLKNYPVAAIDQIASEKVPSTMISLEEPYVFKTENLNKTELVFQTNLSAPLNISFSNKGGEHFSFEMNPATKELLFDRTQAGLSNFEERFAGTVQKAAYETGDREVEVRLFLDASSVEVFVDKGTYVFTNQLFPQNPYTELQISGEKDARLNNFRINQLKSIWHNE